MTSCSRLLYRGPWRLGKHGGQFEALIATAIESSGHGRRKDRPDEAARTLNTIYTNPRVTGLGLLVILSGIPLYWWFSQRRA